jgi:pimeloyl-ACP methyl ester carboxylesterase
VATYVLIPGAGGVAWYWHLVELRLRALGHDVVAVDLPADDGSAGLAEYLRATLEAIGGRTDLIVVGQSLGGFTAPLVCDRLRVDLLVLVAAMVPAPGESGGQWWANTGQEEAARAAAERDGRVWEFDTDVLFLHDVPPELVAEGARHEREQSDGPFRDPWPLPRWPDVPTRFLLCTRDRLFPAEFQRRVVRERLGITPDELDSGHLPALANPDGLVERLEAYRSELTPA